MLDIVRCRDHLRAASPAPYARIMGSSFIRLFSGGRRFARFWDTLEIELHEACAMEMARNPSLHQGSLLDKMREQFHLDPIRLGSVEEVTIAGHQYEYVNQGLKDLGLRASAKVRFVGSKVLLQTPPEPGYRFAFPGRPTKAFLHLGSHLPDMDARQFLADVKQELARIEPVLAAFAPTVREYDTRLRERIEAKVRTF